MFTSFFSPFSPPSRLLLGRLEVGSDGPRLFCHAAAVRLSLTRRCRLVYSNAPGNLFDIMTRFLCNSDSTNRNDAAVAAHLRQKYTWWFTVAGSYFVFCLFFIPLSAAHGKYLTAAMVGAPLFVMPVVLLLLMRRDRQLMAREGQGQSSPTGNARVVGVVGTPIADSASGHLGASPGVVGGGTNSYPAP